MERRELEAGEEEFKEWLEACVEDELEEPEEVKSRDLGRSSSDDGMHSHVSRSENLE